MRTSRPAIPLWVILPVVLAIETALFAVLAAAALDVFVNRPQQGGGSITTLLPGFVYASATVMKVCVVSTLLSVVVGFAWRSGSNPPVWGMVSMALTPSVPFLGALAVLAAQRLIAAPDGMSASHFSHVARSAVFVMLVILFAAGLAALISLIRRERPRLLPLLALLANMVLIGLFLHLRFYALGFDQDLWAPR